MPNIKVIIAIAAPALPGAAEALKQLNRKDIKLTGLSVPSLCKNYVKSGLINNFILWNTVDLGYITVLASRYASEGKLTSQSHQLGFGRLGDIKIIDNNVMLGEPFLFDASNIDQFNF
jgi:rhamnose transport system permease protein